MIKPEAFAEDLVEDRNNAWVDEQIPERVAPGALPADEITQVSATGCALQELRAA